MASACRRHALRVQLTAPYEAKRLTSGSFGPYDGLPVLYRYASMNQKATTCLLFLVGLLVTLPADSGVDTDWIELSSMPTPRSEMSAAVLDGRIYVPGGLGGMRAFEVFDPDANTWQSLARLPNARHHLMTAAHSGCMYVFGGAGERWRAAATATAWAHDPTVDRWHSAADMPGVRYAGAAVVLGEYNYVVGGGGPTGSLLRYHPKRDKWTRLTPLMERREHTSAVALDGRIYAIGGHTAAALSGSIIVLGGEVIMNARRTLDEVEVLTPESRVWMSAPPLPLPAANAGGRFSS